MKISKSEDGLEFYVTSDGFSFGDFNKAGKMDLWKIAKHFEAGRSASYKLALTRVLGLSSSIGSFLRYQSIDISPEFYTSASVTSPWSMTTKLCHVGKTSYWAESETICKNTGITLARNRFQTVRIDRSTRRPVPLLQENFEIYKKSSTPEALRRYEFPETKPDGAFTFSTTTLPSDIDSNKHVNHSASFMYCLDSASLAAMQGGVFEKFSNDMAYYNVKSFIVDYVGELVVGDMVDVSCWEDNTDTSILYFQLRVGERVACRCVGMWYTNPDGSLVDSVEMVNYKSLLITPASKM